MGVCLSRCCDKRAAQVTEPAADSSLEPRTKAAVSPYDPNHSLKRYLHLNQEIRKSSTSTPRTSFVESVAVPHSSELFSLPGSELELRSSFGMSPASISSQFSLTPPPRGCGNKRVRGVTNGAHVDSAARQRLVDAIARLERLNDAGKSSVLGIHGCSICSSEQAPVVVPVTVPAKSKQPSTRSRHVRHFQLPLRQHSLCSSKDTTFSHSSKLVSFDSAPMVTDFLRTVETFVSLMDAPRSRDSNTNTPKFVTKRHELEVGEEMFTIEFGASAGVRNQPEQLPACTKTTVSLQRLVQSATNPLHGQKSPVPEVVMPVVESARSREWKSPSSTWPSIEMFVEQSETVATARVSAVPDVKPLRENEGDAARPTVRRNVVATKKTKSPRVSSGARAPKGLRRGRLSRSLDSIESSALHVDLEMYRTAATSIAAARQLSGVASPRKHTIEVDEKRTEVETLPVSSSWTCKLEQSDCEHKLELEEKCGDGLFDDSTTAELASPQIVPSREVASLVEDGIPSIDSSVSGPGEPTGKFDNASEMKKPSCEETQQLPRPGERRQCSSDRNGDSQRFGLAEAFHSLLKLLVVSTTKHSALDPDEENQYGVLPWS